MPSGTAVTRREWRLVALYTLAILALTTLPYLLAWARQGADWRFTGFLFGVEDGFSYLGKMRLGARGLWEFTLFYTPEPHNAAPLFFLPYIVPGQVVGRLIDADGPALAAALAAAYHVLRLACDALLIAALYRFIAAFARPVSIRLVALVLATLGGGLGWLLAPFGATPPEFYIPEGFTFLILFGLPHLALARAALLGGLLVLAERRGARAGLVAGLLWLVAGLAVPFYLVVVYAVVGAWGVAAWWRGRAFPWALFRRAALAGGLTLPLFVYYALVFSTNPIFGRWSAQNQLASPPPLHYLLAYALLLIPAAVGARAAWRRARRDGRQALLVAWLPAGLLLVYLPVNVQRRLGEGVIVPLAILAAGGVYRLARAWALARPRRLSAPRFTRLAGTLLVVTTISSGLLLLGSVLLATRPGTPLFRPAAELALFDWLDANAAPDDVVLAAVATGNALPAYADVRPYMGHGPETVDWPARTRDVERFFGGDMDASERAALLAFPIRYVVYGPAERALAGGGEAPAWSGGMTVAYDAGGYRVYAVEPPALDS